MVQIVSEKNINPIEWEFLIKNSSTASFFQSEDCYNFYRSLSFLKTFLIGVSENGKLVGLICGYVICDGKFIKSYLSRRAIIPGGALIANDISNEALELLLIKLKNELQNKAIYIEFRNYNDYGHLKSIFGNNEFQYTTHMNFHLNIKDVDSALMKLNTTKRRDVRSSQRNGIEWSLSIDENEMHDYYIILSNLYRTKIKTPLFPEEFFQKLIQTNGGRFLSVKYNNEIIGGSICVELPGNVLYEWFVCGLDGKYKNIFPSTVATWAAIEYAAMNGFYRFDMMGAGKPNEGYGVRDFKSKFGGELVEHGRFTKINNPILFQIGSLYVNLKKKFK